MMHNILRQVRHQWQRHWRTNIAVFACLTLAAALLAGFSGYTEAIAARELSQTLNEVHSAERNLIVTGPRTAFGAELDELLRERLKGLVDDWLVIRHATSPADGQPSLKGTIQGRTITLLDLYSLNTLSENVRVVAGKLPSQVHLREAEDTWRPPPIEAVIGVQAAEQSGYGIGDRLSGSGTYHRLDIVGIVEPLDPNDDVWGGDLGHFAVINNTGDLDADAIALPLIISPASMRSHYPEEPIFPHEVTWRITLKHHLISVDRAEALRTDLINFQTQSATLRATTSTGLVRILTAYMARISRVRMVFWLLSAQTLFFVLYTLTLFTSFVVDRSQIELATQAARGASAWQLTRVFALEYLILGLPAALLGLGLAQAATYWWVRNSGELVPSALPGESWLLAGIIVGLGWMALVLPIFTAARRYVRTGQAESVRPLALSVMQRNYVDLYLLAFGALLYWQLNQTGSFVARAIANGRPSIAQPSDPLLLLGPTLLLIAAAMVLLRLWPFLLRIASGLSSRLQGLMLHLSLARLARDPLPASRMVFLVSLTGGLILFTRAFADSLAHSPEAVAQRADELAQGVRGALQLNALTLILFSVIAFFLVHLIAAQGRGREFGVLQTLGVPARRSLALLGIEGTLVLLMGLLAGTVVGLGLAYTMMPFLAQALGESLAGITIQQIQIDWPAIAQLYALIIGLYGLALVLLLLILLRTGRHWISWTEDE